NDDGGTGHPHSFLWNDGTLPAYDKLFESTLLEIEEDVETINIVGITDAIEGDTDGVFTVSLPDGVLATEDIDVTYTVSGDASEGVDYSSLSGTVTISNGSNSADITITASDDGLDEGSETVIIELTGTTFGTLDVTPAEIFISDVVLPSDITAGDIAIVGWKAGSGTGELAFLLLKDIEATTKISISNRSWKGSQDGWTGDFSIDDVWTWTPGAAFSIGDIFKLDSDGIVRRVTGDAAVVAGTTSHDYTGKVAESSDGDFDFATGGDGILIYHVDPFSLPEDPNSSAWITGLNTNGGWGTGGGNTFCQLPSALTNGENANAVGTDQDNGIYVGPLSGSVAQLRASINDSANWTTSETTNYNLWSFNETNGGTSGEIGSAGSLGLEDVSNSELSIFPNPTSDYFNLNFNKQINNLEIEIFTITGKSIKKIKKKGTSKLRLDVSNFSQGIYFLRVKADDAISIEKVLKNK
ncbi:T9SS type A sorting domain-containing protein, partial [Algibacter sp.]|uniref:T9SS type A sorting domain-containing protein n=1 Tax=Algibacter sp. TaxID=1872428 RepID=UPI003C74C0EF